MVIETQMYESPLVPNQVAPKKYIVKICTTFANKRKNYANLRKNFANVCI